MQTKAALYFLIGFFLISTAEIASHAYAASTPTKGESLDELHEKTKKEGGKLNLYASLSGKFDRRHPAGVSKTLSWSNRRPHRCNR